MTDAHLVLPPPPPAGPRPRAEDAPPGYGHYTEWCRVILPFAGDAVIARRWERLGALEREAWAAVAAAYPERTGSGTARSAAPPSPDRSKK